MAQNLETKLSLDVSQFLSALKQVAKAAGNIDLNIDVNDDDIKAALKSVQKLDGESANVKVNVDDAEIKAAAKKKDKLGEDESVKIKVDDSSLSKALDSFKDIGPSLQKGLDPSALLGGLAGGIAGVAAGLGTALLEGLGSAVSAGFEFQKTLGDIQLQLGIGAEEAAKLGNEAEKAFSKGVGENAAEAAKIVAGLAKSFKLDAGSDQLADIAIQADRVGKAFGKDATEIGQLGSQLTKQFGTNAVDAINLVAAGMQGAGTATDDLLDTIGEFSVNFKTAGFSAEEFVGILKGAEGFNTALIGDSIKELGIRLAAGDVKAGFDALQGSLDKGMLDSLTRMQDLASKGVISQKAFLDESLTQIKDQYDKGLIDAAQAQQLQVALLGSKAEDLGFEGVNKAFINPEKAGADAEKAAANVANAFKAREKDFKLSDITGGFSAAIATIGNGLSEFIGKYIMPLVDGIRNAFSGFEGGGIGDWLDGLKAAFDAVFPFIEALVLNSIKNIVTVITFLRGVVTGIIDGIKAAFSSDKASEGPSFLDRIKEAGQALVLIFQKVQPAINNLVGTIGKVFGSLVRIILIPINVIQKLIRKLFDFGGAAKDQKPFLDQLGEALDSVVGFIDGLVKGIELGIAYFNRFIDLVTDLGAALYSLDFTELTASFDKLVGLFTGSTKVEVPVEIKVDENDVNAQLSKQVQSALDSLDTLRTDTLGGDQKLIAAADARNFKALGDEAGRSAAALYASYDAIKQNIKAAKDSGNITTDQEAALLKQLDARFKLTNAQTRTVAAAKKTELEQAQELFAIEQKRIDQTYRKEIAAIEERKRAENRTEDNDSDTLRRANAELTRRNALTAKYGELFKINGDAVSGFTSKLNGLKEIEILDLAAGMDDLTTQAREAADALKLLEFELPLNATQRELDAFTTLFEKNAANIENRYSKLGDFIADLATPRVGQSLVDQALRDITELEVSIVRLRTQSAFLDKRRTNTSLSAEQRQKAEEQFQENLTKIEIFEKRIELLRTNIRSKEAEAIEFLVEFNIQYPEGASGVAEGIDRVRRQFIAEAAQIKREYDLEVARVSTSGLPPERVADAIRQIGEKRNKQLRDLDLQRLSDLDTALKAENGLYAFAASLRTNFFTSLYGDGTEANNELARIESDLDSKQALLESNLRLGIISYQEYNSELNALAQERIDAEKAADEAIAKSKLDAVKGIANDTIPALTRSTETAALELNTMIQEGTAGFADVAGKGLEVLANVAAQSIAVGISQSESFEDIARISLKAFDDIALDQLSVAAFTAIAGGTFAEVASTGLLGLLKAVGLTAAITGILALAKGQIYSVIGFDKGGLIEGRNTFLGVDSQGRLIRSNEKGNEFIMNHRGTADNLEALNWVNSKPGRTFDDWAMQNQKGIGNDTAAIQLARVMDDRLGRLENTVDRAIRENASIIRSQQGLDVRVAADPGTTATWIKKQAKMNSSR